MYSDQQRNPFLIFVFTIIGSTIRYIFFYIIYQIKGEKPKGFYDFSNGSNQVIYNLLLILLLIFGSVFLFAYYSLKDHGVH